MIYNFENVEITEEESLKFYLAIKEYKKIQGPTKAFYLKTDPPEKENDGDPAEVSALWTK